MQTRIHKLASRSFMLMAILALNAVIVQSLSGVAAPPREPLKQNKTQVSVT